MTLANGRFIAWRSLGLGALAETLEGVDRRDGRAVAIKRFFVGKAKTWKDVELVEREARILLSLSHHALPAYIDHFEEGGELYLVMEYIEGESLATFAQTGHRISLPELRNLLSMLSEVLEYLHSRVPPIIHRDIKPGNIIRRPDGGYCLIDFGSVREGLLPEGGSTVAGTFGYMAPEQFQGRAVLTTDVYAIGALVLTLLSGRAPDKLPHQGLAIDVEAALQGTVPAKWVDAIEQLVNINPDARPSSLKALLNVLDDTGVSADRDVYQHSTKQFNDETRENQREHDLSCPISAGTWFGVVPFLALTISRLFVRMLGVVVRTARYALSHLFGGGLRRVAWQVSRPGLCMRTFLAKACRGDEHAKSFVFHCWNYQCNDHDDSIRKSARGDWRSCLQRRKRYIRLNTMACMCDPFQDCDQDEDQSNRRVARHRWD